MLVWQKENEKRIRELLGAHGKWVPCKVAPAQCEGAAGLAACGTAQRQLPDTLPRCLLKSEPQGRPRQMLLASARLCTLALGQVGSNIPLGTLY